MYSTVGELMVKRSWKSHRPPIVGGENQHGSHRKHVGGKRIPKHCFLIFKFSTTSFVYSLDNTHDL